MAKKKNNSPLKPLLFLMTLVVAMAMSLAAHVHFSKLTEIAEQLPADTELLIWTKADLLSTQTSLENWLGLSEIIGTNPEAHSWLGENRGIFRHQGELVQIWQITNKQKARAFIQSRAQENEALSLDFGISCYSQSLQLCTYIKGQNLYLSTSMSPLLELALMSSNALNKAGTLASSQHYLNARPRLPWHALMLVHVHSETLARRVDLPELTPLRPLLNKAGSFTAVLTKSPFTQESNPALTQRPALYLESFVPLDKEKNLWKPYCDPQNAFQPSLSKYSTKLPNAQMWTGQDLELLMISTDQIAPFSQALKAELAKHTHLPTFPTLWGEAYLEWNSEDFIAIGERQSEIDIEDILKTAPSFPRVISGEVARHYPFRGSLYLTDTHWYFASTDELLASVLQRQNQEVDPLHTQLSLGMNELSQSTLVLPGENAIMMLSGRKYFDDGVLTRSLLMQP